MNLSKLKADEVDGLSKDEGIKRTEELCEKITELQELMFADGQMPLLIVLQGRDTSGKDGTIRHLLTFMNAQSTRVESFKVPTWSELAHDFLWRVHARTPGKGETVIFNRSHYEDVLVVRVHNIVPSEVWEKRYDHINNFEKLLADSGVKILKFMLHISKEEQEKRLLEREEDPTKSWKINPGDWKEREFWDHYTDAYQAALDRCNFDHAPWTVVPADKKWYRNYVVTKTIYEALKPLEKEWRKNLDAKSVEMKAVLAEYRAQLPKG
jgi:PPK2 family polyphosphate:nucleotide phosphotransferase